jgi:uncharacterized protein YhhL (DUF1145 family)
MSPRFLVLLKALLLIFWMVFLLSALKTWSDPWRIYINWMGIFILCIHLIEAIWFVSKFGNQLAEPKFEKMQVLVFGVLHWGPALKKLKSTTQR